MLVMCQPDRICSHGKNQFHILFMHFFCQRISHTKAILMAGNTVERIRCFNDFYKIVV